MSDIFVNLKRFDVPRSYGGICPTDDPQEWIRSVIRETVQQGLGTTADLKLTYLLPEGLVLPAREELERFPQDERSTVSIGVEGVFRHDVQPGGNFGAFTSNLPATAAKNLGAEWAIVGHSEERKDKLGILSAYDQEIDKDDRKRKRALETVNRLIQQETASALEAGMDVLVCIGETAEERGEGSFEEQKARVREALRSQVEVGLEGVANYLSSRRLVVGYEPIWAIGPGKTPPGQEYISFVSRYIKEAAQELHGFTPPVVYGGGLKQENAAMVSAIPTIDGGLVALTKFTQPVAFEPSGLKTIIDTYMKAGSPPAGNT